MKLNNEIILNVSVGAQYFAPGINIIRILVETVLQTGAKPSGKFHFFEGFYISLPCFTEVFLKHFSKLTHNPHNP
jgi:hypothetical protein